jgi:hypothetical protein
MTVKELITKLLDRPMKDEVLLCYNKEHIDDYGNTCIGYAFNVDDVQGSNIMFTDWRDTKSTPILDKVRAEIDKIYNREGNSFDCLNALDELKEFIDKYKAESEKA